MCGSNHYRATWNASLQAHVSFLFLFLICCYFFVFALVDTAGDNDFDVVDGAYVAIGVVSTYFVNTFVACIIIATFTR